MKRKCLLAAVLLISAVSTSAAQTYWSYGAYGPWGYGAYGAWGHGAYGPWRNRAYGQWSYREYGLKARGYYGTPMVAVRNMAVAAATSTAMDPLTATPVRRRAGIRSASLFAVVTHANGYLRQPLRTHDSSRQESRCDCQPEAISPRLLALGHFPQAQGPKHGRCHNRGDDV